MPHKHYSLTISQILQNLETLGNAYEQMCMGTSPTGNYFFACDPADAAASLKSAAVLVTQIQSWISVSERLPVEGEPVLACWFRRKDSMACAMIRNLNGKVCWTPSDQFAECDPPLAWMPLPEPPEANQ